jgi:carbon storage regulator CsrA
LLFFTGKTQVSLSLLHFKEENIMLVLSRKSGEEIVIGDDIRVIVNRVSGNRVTLGIVAPKDVHVLRAELTPVSCPVEKPVASDSRLLAAM